MQVHLKVNGKDTTADVPPHTLLVQVLREHLKLTGTHVGCDTAQCGACTVMKDGRAIKSCNVLAAQVDGSDITTIEGVAAADGTMHPMQASFKECHGLQCGFCTPGLLTTLIEFLRDNPDPTEREVRVAISGNLCRCTGYEGIVAAALDAARRMRAGNGQTGGASA